MGNKNISYLNRTFDEYRNSIIERINKYYPDIENGFNDASIGSWLVDLVASVADNLSYHIDRVYNETTIDGAQQSSSIYALARSNGLRVPGPKASMAEAKFTCELPVTTGVRNSSSTLGMPNYAYAPVIKKGTRMESGNQIFEVYEDIDFSQAFNSGGFYDRTVVPVRDANGNIKSYKIEKRGVIIAGESTIHKVVISSENIVPFMEYIIPDNKVISVESIIFKDGTNYTVMPSMGEFSINDETYPKNSSDTKIWRFFEVDSLTDQYRWGNSISEKGNESYPNNTRYTYGEENENYNITKGEWKPLTQKFVTEFTDKGYLKITFGSGEQIGQEVDYSDATDFSKYQISKMVRNNFLGKLPKEMTTMFILYRRGGGASSNVAKGAISSFTYLNVDIAKCVSGADQKIINQVKNSISVENTTPSVSGKDAPSVDEIKEMIKNNNASQNRCITLTDYKDRIMKMPPEYGCPFRINVIEENNKIMIFLLNLDSEGHLQDSFPEMLGKNMEEYLSMYRSINDFVEIKAGRIINLSFEVDVYIDRNYDAQEITNKISDVITDYFDVNKRQIGEDIFIGDLQKEINNIDGLLNVIDIRIFNEYGGEYSISLTSQATKESDDETYADRNEIDLDACDYTLTSDIDSMFEIKFKDKNINVRIKQK